MARRPRIGICTALERASWTVWDAEAFLLNRSYVDAVQAAGGLALMLPPDPRAVEDPDELLDVLDGLILAGGADIDPASYGESAHPATKGTWPERDDFEVALARPGLLRRRRPRRPARGRLAGRPGGGGGRPRHQVPPPPGRGAAGGRARGDGL